MGSQIKLLLSRHVVLAVITGLFTLLMAPMNAQTQKAQVVEKTDSCHLTLGSAYVDICNGSFSFPAKVNMGKGLIEVILSTPLGKTHESLLVTEMDAIHFETALFLIGCEQTPAYSKYQEHPSKISRIRHNKNKPDQLEIYVTFVDSSGMKPTRVEQMVWDKQYEKVLDPVLWHFKGLPEDPRGTPRPFSGDNLVVSFMEINSILELDSPRLFDDNYFFVNETFPGLKINREVVVTVKRNSE